MSIILQREVAAMLPNRMGKTKSRPWVLNLICDTAKHQMSVKTLFLLSGLSCDDTKKEFCKTETVSFEHTRAIKITLWPTFT